MPEPRQIVLFLGDNSSDNEEAASLLRNAGYDFGTDESHLVRLFLWIDGAFHFDVDGIRRFLEDARGPMTSC